MLRSITMLPAIEATFVEGKLKFHHRTVIRHVLGTDRRFQSDRAGARIAKRIDDALEETGERVLLAEADWEKLKEAIEKPQPMEGFHAFPSAHAYKYVAFLDAVIDAAEVKNAALALPADVKEEQPKSNGAKPHAETEAAPG